MRRLREALLNVRNKSCEDDFTDTLLVFFFNNLRLFSAFHPAECQSKVRLLGGLRALVIRLKQVMDLKEHVEQDILFMERVVNTLGSIIAGHGEPIFFGSTVLMNATGVSHALPKF